MTAFRSSSPQGMRGQTQALARPRHSLISDKTGGGILSGEGAGDRSGAMVAVRGAGGKGKWGHLEQTKRLLCQRERGSRKVGEEMELIKG